MEIFMMLGMVTKVQAAACLRTATLQRLVSY